MAFELTDGDIDRAWASLIDGDDGLAFLEGGYSFLEWS